MTGKDQSPRRSGSIEHFDAVIIGAGVSGMYALHHPREMGLSVRVYDGARDIGGTWWYNRYPGARVDGPGSPASRRREQRFGREVAGDPERLAADDPDTTWCALPG